MADTIRVLVVDDHTVVRRGLTRLLRAAGRHRDRRRGRRRQRSAGGRPTSAARRRAHGPADADHGRRDGDRAHQGRAARDRDRGHDQLHRGGARSPRRSRPAPPATCSRMPRPRRSPSAVRDAYPARCISIPAVARLLAERLRERKPAAASSAEPLTEREKEVLCLVGAGPARTRTSPPALFITERTATDLRQQHPGQAGLAESDPGGALGAGPRPRRSSRLKELRQYQAAPLHPWRAASGLMASLCWARVKRSRSAARRDARGRAIGDDGRGPRRHPTRHRRGSGGHHGPHPSGAPEPARPRLASIRCRRRSATTSSGWPRSGLIGEAPGSSHPLPSSHRSAALVSAAGSSRPSSASAPGTLYLMTRRETEGYFARFGFEAVRGRLDPLRLPPPVPDRSDRHRYLLDPSAPAHPDRGHA